MVSRWKRCRLYDSCLRHAGGRSLGPSRGHPKAKDGLVTILRLVDITGGAGALFQDPTLGSGTPAFFTNWTTPFSCGCLEFRPWMSSPNNRNVEMVLCDEKTLWRVAIASRYVSCEWRHLGGTAAAGVARSINNGIPQRGHIQLTDGPDSWFERCQCRW